MSPDTRDSGDFEGPPEGGHANCPRASAGDSERSGRFGDGQSQRTEGGRRWAASIRRSCSGLPLSGADGRRRGKPQGNSAGAALRCAGVAGRARAPAAFPGSILPHSSAHPGCGSWLRPFRVPVADHQREADSASCCASRLPSLAPAAVRSEGCRSI